MIRLAVINAQYNLSLLAALSERKIQNSYLQHTGRTSFGRVNPSPPICSACHVDNPFFSDLTEGFGHA